MSWAKRPQEPEPGASKTPPEGNAQLETELKDDTGQAAQNSELTLRPADIVSSSSMSMSNSAGTLVLSNMRTPRGYVQASGGFVKRRWCLAPCTRKTTRGAVYIQCSLSS